MTPSSLSAETIKNFLYASTATVSMQMMKRGFRNCAIGENIQRNFHSGANSQQTFGKFEKALGWYHDGIKTALAAASTG